MAARLGLEIEFELGGTNFNDVLERVRGDDSPSRGVWKVVPSP